MFDVVVIGAGLSGLQAAYTAQQAGLSVAIVEARDRVGGKVWSVPLASKRGMADLGAAWVNDTLQPRIWAYVEKFGLHVVKQRLEGKAVMQRETGERIVFPYGITPEFTPEEKKNLELVRDHIQALSKSPEAPLLEDDQISLDQYVRNLGAVPSTLQMVNVWSRVMHGVESTEQSAAWFIDYCRRNRGLLAIRADDHTGGNYMRIIEGTQAIANGIANLVGKANIHLSSPVASVENNKTHTTVTTTTGKTFVGKKCIISVPSTLYQDINITPPLPQASREIANATTLGHYNKAIVFYSKPWWRDLGYNGFMMSYSGPIVVARDTSVDEKGVYGLTCFVNGRNGKKWGKMYPHERRSVVLDQIAAIFSVGLDSEAYRPVEFFEQIWKHEPFSKGALAPVHAIGDYTRPDSLYGKPVGNLHFVGTEFSPDWKGYMEGALCSGEIGAKEVARVLGQQKPIAKL